jgi:hypothetical protein
MNSSRFLKHIVPVLTFLYVLSIFVLRIYKAYNEQGLALIGWDNYDYLARGLCFYRAPIDYVIAYASLPRMPDIINGIIGMILPSTLALPLIAFEGVFLNTLLLTYIYINIRHSKEEYSIYIVLLLTLLPFYFIDFQRFYWYIIFLYLAIYFALARNSLRRSIVLYLLGVLLTYNEINLISIFTIIYLILLFILKSSHFVVKFEKYVYIIFVIILISYLVFLSYKMNLLSNNISMMFMLYYILSIILVFVYLYIKKAYIYGAVIILLSLPFIYLGRLDRIAFTLVLFLYIFLPYIKYKNITISSKLYNLILFLFGLAFTILHVNLMATNYYLNSYRHWFTSSDISFALSLASYINKYVNSPYVLFIYDFDFYGRDIIFFDLVQYFTNCKFYYYIYKLDNHQTNMPINIYNITYIYIDFKSKKFTLLSQENFLNISNTT